jgi:hypothetical protein
VELEISWPNTDTEPIDEWLEAEDVAGTRCVAIAGYAMCFITFTPTLHLRCMSLLSVVLDAIPQIHVSAKMVTEVTSRLLHFLVTTVLSSTTVAVVCSRLASLTCATPTLLVASAP